MLLACKAVRTADVFRNASLLTVVLDIGRSGRYWLTEEPEWTISSHHIRTTLGCHRREP